MSDQTCSFGAFSISLAVKDIEASRAFYAKLGFETTGGDASQNWLILRNGPTVIGLFQGMFDKNILTFNPGWNAQAEKVEAFTDVREHQRRLEAEGVEITTRADESSSGPASFVVVDPGVTSMTMHQLLSEEQYYQAQDDYGEDAFVAQIGAEHLRPGGQLVLFGSASAIGQNTRPQLWR